MRWPWQTGRNPHRLVLAPASGKSASWAFVLTDGAPAADRPARVLRWGHLAGAAPGAPPAGEVIGLLDPAHYQILKVDTPSVPQDELKAAARWQIKELVDVDPAELTLDVMHVGGDVDRPHRQTFVVAARNRAIQSLCGQIGAAGAQPQIVDVWETALRNLVNHQAAADDLAERACAGVLVGARHCLLVVCARGELFYTRRIEPDPGLLARASGALPDRPSVEVPLGYEYQPGGDFQPAGLQESPLVVELQRSIDVWERSWPDLPLARLYIISPEHGSEVAALVQRELGQRTVWLDALSHFAPAPAAIEGSGSPVDGLTDCLPLLGAALRVDKVKL